MTHLRRRVRAPGTYFVTSNTWQRRRLFHKQPPAKVFLQCLFHYRNEGHYLLHEFVLMPDHFHLLPTPGANLALERALQLIKGGSSHRIRKELRYTFPIWQTGFDDHRIRSAQDYQNRCTYIHNNPVARKLVGKAEAYLLCSACERYKQLVDPWSSDLTSAAKAASIGAASTGRAEARPRQNINAEKPGTSQARLVARQE